MSALAIPAVPTPTLAECLAAARHHHARGALREAAESYRQALEHNPQSQPALLGLSLIARQSLQPLAALRMAEAALTASPASALAWSNYGDMLVLFSQTTSAEAAFRHALTLDATIAAAHYGLGNCLALKDRFTPALASFQTAVRLAPNLPDFHFALAFAHGKLAQHADAITAYRRALTLRPNFASAWLNLGVELVADGRDGLAAPCYAQAIATAAQMGSPGLSSSSLGSSGLGSLGRSTQISAYLNLGHLARSRRSFPRAQKQYQRALALAQNEPSQETQPPSQPSLSHTSPQNRLAEVHIAFAYLHLEQKQFPQAWQSLRAAESAHASPNQDHPNPEIANTRGILLLAEHSAAIHFESPEHYAQLVEEAIASFQQAETAGHKTAASNRGNALLRLGRCQEALAAHQAARDPHHPGIQHNLALTQLRTGDFAQGWPNYEIRWSFREVHPHPRRFHQPLWQGERLTGPTLLLYAEQGLGDTIQFIRYLPLILQCLPQAHILLEVQPALIRLLTPCAAEIASRHGASMQILAMGEQLPHFTHHCPLMSLPAVFATTLRTIPSSIPYLPASPESTTARSRELGLQPDILSIGLNWAGNPSYRADYERSTRLQTFVPLLEIPGIRWISLQKGEAARQIHDLPQNLSLSDASSQDRDLADTAALIASLDLVLTTDSAVAHLAGALGKPLWLLLPWQSDWRWMQDRLDTPWYPTARLFRQQTPGNWPELIQRVARELQSMLSSRQSAHQPVHHRPGQPAMPTGNERS